MEPSLLPDATVRYADHPDGLLDVHLPSSPDGRTVFLVHGGFWRTAYDRTHTRPLAVALREQGWTVVTPEYRRVPPEETGLWPRTGADVRAALDATPGALTDLGCPVTSISAVGHSAGGHLVLWLAADGAPLRRVVALAAVCDLREAIRRGLGSDAARAFLGGIDPAEADPMTLLPTDAGSAPGPELVLVHGADDDVVPLALSQGFVDAHPHARLVTLPDADHFDVIAPSGPGFAALLAALA